MSEDVNKMQALWKTKLDSNTDDLRDTLQEILNKCSMLSPCDQKEANTVILSFIKKSNRTEISCKTGLDLAYKSFYKIVVLQKQDDIELLPKFDQLDIYQRSYILYAILFTEYHRKLDQYFLQEKCAELINISINQNSKNLIIIIRTMNLFLKNYELDIPISLHQLYFCLQTHIFGIRDEVLNLFELQTRKFENASEIFKVLIIFWPWTNKYKFYFLASIISNHKLDRLADSTPMYDEGKFFDGIRLSLTHKNLLSAGQVLVRSLSKQGTKGLLGLICSIIKHGSEKEISNFNSQWMRLIQQKEEIATELGFKRQWKDVLDDAFFSGNVYKFVVVCNMFFQQFSQHTDFGSLVNYLIENCFNYDLKTQIEIYNLAVGCQANPKTHVKTILEFIIAFISNHISIPCANIRHTIIRNFPLILNFLAKVHEDKNLTNYVKTFFKDLQEIYICGILKQEYQPLFLSLKLVHAVLHCLYATGSKRLSKKSNITQNHKLGNFLIAEKILSFEELERSVFSVLQSSGDYDDIRDLIITILSLISKDCYIKSLESCKAANCSSEIDRCFVSSFFLRISINNCKSANKKDLPGDFFKECLTNLTNSFREFQVDPLFACRSGLHLFGHINSLNELCNDEFCRANIEDFNGNIIKIIETAELIVDIILRYLNTAENDPESSAASFQVMDESLELLVCRSKYISTDHIEERKFLLLSFWITLKACCDIATVLGIYFSKDYNSIEKSIDLLDKCLRINILVLYRCRHKGAIEAAGVSIGKLVKEITARHMSSSSPYQLLYSIFPVLFGGIKKISTTRRGAGLSIMLHHMVKNDIHRGRPLFQYAIRALLDHAKETKDAKVSEDQQYENFDALVLHYLCVLVKDTDLRADIFQFYDEIMMASIMKIEDKEWTVRNAALQLFGAVVPKILGQKQAVDAEEPQEWEPTEVTFTEIIFGLPKTCKYILQYCDDTKEIKTTSSVILFLGFLSDVNYWRKDDEEENHFNIILKFRNLFWGFLSHECENVRRLAAKCLVRSHEFYYEIPKLLFCITDCFFNITNANLLLGLISCMIACINKQFCESKYSSSIAAQQFLHNFQDSFYKFYTYRELSFYVRSKLLDLLVLADFNFKNIIILEILCSKQNATLENIKKIALNSTNSMLDFGFKMWKIKVCKVFEIDLELT